jgi:hypothetical protein
MKRSKKNKGVQFTFRWSATLDSMLKAARNHQRNSRPIKKIVAQALRRCLPFPKDPRPERINGKESRGVEIASSLHARLQRVAKLPGRIDDPNNASLVVIEALCRYFYFRAKHFDFKDGDVEATGYTKENEPPQPHHDEVKDFEELLEDRKYSALAESVQSILDSELPDTPNSLNQLMVLAQPHRKSPDKGVEDWVNAVKIFIDEFEKNIASEFARELGAVTKHGKPAKRHRGERR